MSDFDLLIETARQQKPIHFELDNDQKNELTDFNVPVNIDQTSRDQNYEAFRELERMREQNPRYLAEKERLRIMEMDKEGSPFQHPCQNEQNTITLVSENKEHEVDIEVDSASSSVLINFVRVDPTNRETFLKLLTVVRCYLRELSIEKIYQNIVISDWENVISNFKEFKLVRIVNPVGNPAGDDGFMAFGFAIVEMAADDLITGVSKALGMNAESHLDNV